MEQRWTQSRGGSGGVDIGLCHMGHIHKSKLQARAIVKIARTETEALSRRESVEIETRQDYVSKRNNKTVKKLTGSFLNSNLLLNQTVTSLFSKISTNIFI